MYSNGERTEKARRRRLTHRLIHPIEAVVVRLVEVNVRVAGLDGSGRKNRALEDEVRTVRDQDAVLETAGLVLARVADDVAWSGCCFCRHGPLPAGWETRAAAPSQAGGGDFPEDGGRGKTLL